MYSDQIETADEQPMRPKVVGVRKATKQLSAPMVVKNVTKKPKLQQQPSFQNIINITPAASPAPVARKRPTPKIEQQIGESSDESLGFGDASNSAFSGSERSSFSSPPDSPISYKGDALFFSSHPRSGAIPKARGSLQEGNEGNRPRRDQSPAPRGYDIPARTRERQLERKLMRDREVEERELELERLELERERLERERLERERRELEHNLLQYGREDLQDTEHHARRLEARHDMITYRHHGPRAPSMERRQSAHNHSPPRLQPQLPLVPRNRPAHAAKQILPPAPEPSHNWQPQCECDDCLRAEYEDLMRRQEAARLEAARLHDELARQAQWRKSQAHDFWADANSARQRERGRARPARSDSLSDESVPRPLSRGIPREEPREPRKPGYTYVRARWSAPARLDRQLPYPV